MGEEDFELQDFETKEEAPGQGEAWEADQLARDAGLSVENSEVLLKAYNCFLRGDSEEGLEQTKLAIQRHQEDKAKELAQKEDISLTDAHEKLGKEMSVRHAGDLYCKGIITAEEAMKAGVKFI